MSAKLGTHVQAKSTQAMLCPCCGGNLFRSTQECGCGARFVGEPLDETPLKVQRLGPAMTSVALLALVVVAALVATKWLAFVAVLVIWSAWRAVRLARKDPEWYGGYRTAAATLAVSLMGSAGLAAYGIAHIPQALENYKTRQIAATESTMYHWANSLEEYKRTIGGGSYPKDAQEFKKATGETLPADYWDQRIKYQTTTDAIADRTIGESNRIRESNRIPFNSFELRSAGPDGILGTDDDIIMRDGIFFTNSEVKKQTVVQQLR